MDGWEPATQRGHGSRGGGGYDGEAGNEAVPPRAPPSSFQTARQKLDEDERRKGKGPRGGHSSDGSGDSGGGGYGGRSSRGGAGSYGGGGGRGGYHPLTAGRGIGNTGNKRSYSGPRGGGVGLSRPAKRSNTNNPAYQPPFARRDQCDEDDGQSAGGHQAVDPGGAEALGEKSLKGIDEDLVEKIKNEIMEHNPNGEFGRTRAFSTVADGLARPAVAWEDVAGLEFAKDAINESLIWPMKRPDLFTGLRAAVKGLLLFGPPGTGKTLIGKCIASQCDATFFCISASSLT